MAEPVAAWAGSRFCGCRMIRDKNLGAAAWGVYVVNCPTHAAAPEMVELLREVVQAESLGKAHDLRARALLARIDSYKKVGA